jgi:phosphosulfolactate synthase
MNFSISNLPFRQNKPRKQGVTMVMDKGLSYTEAENMIEACGHLVDYVKLGFGTSLITNKLIEKIRLYQKSDIHVFLGGTLFEAFLVRNAIEDYISLCRQFDLKHVEISDGSIQIPHQNKLEMISEFAKHFTVLSEVGSKQANIVLNDQEWIQQINTEIDAGSSMVIAEARESGNVGIYDNSGNPKTDLICLIDENTQSEKIIWEAPCKSQQVWFIKQLGTSVSLGNIAPNEVIALETLRLGLRGDTFFDFLPSELKETHQKQK